MNANTTSVAPGAIGEGSIIGGKFRLERLIGEGGMGVVYAAVHLDLVKHVAIKIVREELSTRQDAVERMLHEARTAASLRSEHVARVLDMGRLDSGAPYIVMEYLDGCDLAWHLDERRTLEPEVAVSFLLQACEAVAEAHVAGVIHRDIKPENLFLATGADGEPMIKVLDFGISKNLARDRTTLTDPSSIVGSPAYMAPEAMQSKHLVGPAADVWSLGAVLYELCTGRRPFDADTVPEVCARVLGEEPVAIRTLSPHVPEGLAAVVHRCLRKDPASRFGSVSDLAAALAPFGPRGAVELAQRVARVASGIRMRPRTVSESTRPPGGGAASGAALVTPASLPAPPVTLATGESTASSSRLQVMSGAFGGGLAVAVLGALLLWWSGPRSSTTGGAGVADLTGGSPSVVDAAPRGAAPRPEARLETRATVAPVPVIEARPEIVPSAPPARLGTPPTDPSMRPGHPFAAPPPPRAPADAAPADAAPANAAPADAAPAAAAPADAAPADAAPADAAPAEARPAPTTQPARAAAPASEPSSAPVADARPTPAPPVVDPWDPPASRAPR